VVHKATLSGMPVVVKSLISHMMAEEIDEFLREAAMLAKLRHPNVCVFYGIGVKSDTMYLVQEYCDGGSLRDFRKFSGYDHRKHTAKFMEQLFKTLHYLHSRAIPVIHRDIKPDNLLIHGGCILKIGDLGTSREQGTTEEEQMMTQNATGTVHYMPPEALRHVYRDKRNTVKPIDGRAWDVYSSALCVLFAYTGVDPFADLSSLTVVRKVLGEDIKPKIGHEVPKSLHSLIKEMYDTDPRLRPTMKQAANRLEQALRHQKKLQPPTPKKSASSMTMMRKKSSVSRRMKTVPVPAKGNKTIRTRETAPVHVVKKNKAPPPPTPVKTKKREEEEDSSVVTKKSPPSLPPPSVKKKKTSPPPSVPPPVKKKKKREEKEEDTSAMTKKSPPSLLPPSVKKKKTSPPPSVPPPVKKKKKKKKKKKLPIPPLPSQGKDE